jgi:hypothetical protein
MKERMKDGGQVETSHVSVIPSVVRKYLRRSDDSMKTISLVFMNSHYSTL